jgi:hypothetical protein
MRCVTSEACFSFEPFQRFPKLTPVTDKFEVLRIAVTKGALCLYKARRQSWTSQEQKVGKVCRALTAFNLVIDRNQTRE